MGTRRDSLRSTARAARHALAALALGVMALLGACRTTIEARASLAPHIDLTQLSLEQLLDLEVIPAERDHACRNGCHARGQGVAS